MLTSLALVLALVQPQHAFSGIARPVNLRAESSSTPHMSYHQGRVVGTPKYFGVYWGGYWNTTAGQKERAYYDGFLHATASSLKFASIVFEYSVEDTPMTAGSFGQSVVDAHEPGASVGDNACDEIVENQIDAGRLPKPDSSNVYIVFLPPGTQSTMFNGLSGKSCSDYCGYHTAQVAPGTGNWILRYIVMPHHDAACPGCMYAAISDGTQADIGRRSETITLSHEMAETQTDPDGAVLSFGWFDNSKLSTGEIGDLCEGYESQLGGYSVSQLWSNKQNACVAQGLTAGGGTGGGCPADMHAEQGYCVPNTPVGCSSTGGGSAAALAVLGLAALARRRRS